MEINEEAKDLLNSVTRITAYLHSSKEYMWELGEDHGLTDEQLESFKYALYEVEFDLDVDKEGNVEIIKVNRRKLKAK